MADDALILKSPLESAVENIKTKAARFFSKDLDTGSDDVVTVELEEPETNFKIQNVINIANIKSIDEFTKHFISELQIANEEKEEQLKNYIQTVIEQYFTVKEPDIQQFLNEKIENVLNNIVNINKQQVTYQNILQKTIEQIVNKNELTKEYQQDVFNEIKTVAPEIVKESLVTIFKNINNNLQSTEREVIEKTISTLQKELVHTNTISNTEREVIEKTISTLQKELVHTNTISNTEREIVEKTIVPVAEDVEITKGTANKLEAVNKDLIKQIPEQNTGSMALSDTIDTQLPTINSSSSDSEPVVSTQSEPRSTSSPKIVMSIEEPHSKYYGYPGFIGISELS